MIVAVQHRACGRMLLVASTVVPSTSIQHTVGPLHMAAGSIQFPRHDQPAVLVKLFHQQILQAWVLGAGQVDELVRVNETHPFVPNAKRIQAMIVCKQLPVFAALFFMIVNHPQVGDEV